jgi:hypothetical protein
MIEPSVPAVTDQIFGWLAVVAVTPAGCSTELILTVRRAIFGFS